MKSLFDVELRKLLRRVRGPLASMTIAVAAFVKAYPDTWIVEDVHGR